MSLGDAFINVRADTAGFAEELKIALEKALKKNSPLTVRIEADTRSAKASLEAFVAAANRKRISIPVDIDTRPGTHSLAQLGLDSEQQAKVFGDAWGKSADRVQQDLARVTGAGFAAKGATGGIGGVAADGRGAAAVFNGLGKDAERAAGSVTRLTGSMGRSLSLFNPYVLAAGAVAVALGAIAVAAEGTTAAVAAIGVTGADKLRSLELTLSDTGLAGDKLKVTLGQIKDLAETGLGLAVAGSAVQELTRAGEDGSTAVATVRALADALAGAGLTGKALSTGVDAATKALVTLSDTVAPTTADLATFASTIGVKTSAVLAQLGTDLGKTKKQVQDLLAAGKVSGQAIGTAGLRAAAALPNTKNGLDNAAATSFEQAALAALTKIQDRLREAFSNPALVASVTRFGDQLGAALEKFGPTAAKAFTDVLTNVGNSLNAISGFLLTVSQGINSFFDQASTKGEGLHTFFVGLGAVLAEAGRIAGEVFGPSIALAVSTVKKLGPALSDVAKIGRSLEPIARLVGVVIAASFERMAGTVALVAAALHKITPAVTAVFNVIGDVVGFIADKVADLLSMLSKVIGIKIFGHGIPGADAAQAQLDGIISGLRSIDGSSATATIHLSAILTPGTAANLAAFGSADRSNVHGFTDDAAAITAELNRQGLGSKPRAPSGGGPSGPSAASQAADRAAAAKADKAAKAAQAAAAKAQALADRIKTALDNIKTSLHDFLADLTGETPKQIRSALNSLTQSFESAAKLEKLPAGTVSKVVALLQRDSLKLQKLAAERLKVEKAIQAGDEAVSASFAQSQAFTSLTAIADAVAQAAAAATDATTKLADLSKIRIILPGQDATNSLIPGKKAISAAQASLAAIQKMLDARVAQIKKFNSDVKAAEKLGLRADVASDLFAGGPEADAALAATLAGATRAQIAAINKSASAARSAATALAKGAGDALASQAQSAGQQVVNGLLAGLKDKDGKLKAAMKNLGDSLVAAIKAALKIKSPSVRMADEVGRHLIPGILAPMDGQHGLLRDAMSRVGDTLAATEFQPIALPALQRLAAAQASMDLSRSVVPQRPAQGASSGMSDRQHRELLAAVEKAGLGGRTIHAPVNINAASAPAVDVAGHLARVVAGIR